MRENIIVMVGGRSGVGKTSIIDFLVKNQGERYARPLSYTSRLKRNGEGCEEYNFISEEKMILMRDEGRFLNFDCVYGNYYAIAKKSIDVINTEGSSVPGLLRAIMMPSLSDIRSLSGFRFPRNGRNP